MFPGYELTNFHKFYCRAKVKLMKFMGKTNNAKEIIINQANLYSVLYNTDNHIVIEVYEVLIPFTGYVKKKFGTNSKR